MFCKEVYGVIKSKKAKVFITILILISVIDLLQLIIEQHIFDYIIYNENRPTGNMLRHPSFAAFLSGGSHGHMWQMIVIWLMPIYILNIYSDSYIREKTNGYTNIVIIRMNEMKYIRGKYIMSFLIPCVIMFSMLIINWGICNFFSMVEHLFKD